MSSRGFTPPRRRVPGSGSCSGSAGWRRAWCGCGTSPCPATSRRAVMFAAGPRRSPSSPFAPQPATTWRGDRSAARRPHAGRGAALLVPVRRRAARQPRHRPGGRTAARHRPRRRGRSSSRGWCSRSAFALGADPHRRRAVTPTARSAVALGCCVVAGRGRSRWRSSPRAVTAPADYLDVAAVQGGGEQGTRALDVPSRLVTERHLEATRTIAARSRPRPRGLAGERDRRRRRSPDSEELSRSRRPRRAASACRSPSASPRTSPAGPAGSRTPRSS